MSDKCPICGEWLFLNFKRHKCPPAWWCWISDPDWGMDQDDGTTIYAIRPSEAVLEYIEKWDAGGDYVCVGGDEMQVSVANIIDPDDVQVFTVRGEMVPEYYATEDR